VADLWYYQQQGEARGPLPLSHLQALVNAREIDAATPVWQQGLPAWVALSSLQRQPASSVEPPPVPLASHKPASRRAAAGSQTPLYVALVVVGILAAALLGYVGRGLLEGPGRQAAAVQPSPAKESQPAPQPRGNSTASPATPPAVSAVAPQPPPMNVEPDPAADVVAPALPAVAAAADPVPPAVPATPAENVANVSSQPSSAASPPGVLFQELDIQRMPKFGMLGTMNVQDLRYQILSQIKVAPPDAEGNIACDQVVLATHLAKADDLSRTMFQDSLAALQGWQFSYQLNGRRVVTQWKSGPPDGKKVAEVKPPGGTGFLATSVIDEDGWKELAQLTFFVPRPERGSTSWKQPMMHNFGPLGSWYGETTFTQQATREGVEQIGFVHTMEYRPPEKDAGGLPFTIEKATLKPEKAGGTIEFDTQANRVLSAQEAFLVRGALSVSLLGQAADVEVEEQQVIGLKLSERNPWTK
jgi:hypothetical protein